MLNRKAKTSRYHSGHTAEWKLDHFLRPVSWRRFEEKKKQRSENSKIRREMARETPVLAGVTETAAGNVQSASFCRNDTEGEDHDGRTQNQKSAAIPKAKHKSERAENFQPRKIKRERNTHGPRQKFEIVDTAGEFTGICERKVAKIGETVGNAEMLKVSNQTVQIEDLSKPRENKDSGENKIENSRENTPEA